TREHVERSAVPLRDIALLSKRLYETWTQQHGMSFSYEPKGMLELFKTEENFRHAEETLREALHLELDVRLLNKEELQAMEPEAEIDALGALFFACDAQLYPNKLMGRLLAWLGQHGVQLEANQEVTSFV